MAAPVASVAPASRGYRYGLRPPAPTKGKRSKGGGKRAAAPAQPAVEPDTIAPSPPKKKKSGGGEESDDEPEPEETPAERQRKIQEHLQKHPDVAWRAPC